MSRRERLLLLVFLLLLGGLAWQWGGGFPLHDWLEAPRRLQAAQTQQAFLVRSLEAQAEVETTYLDQLTLWEGLQSGLYQGPDPAGSFLRDVEEKILHPLTPISKGVYQTSAPGPWIGLRVDLRLNLTPQEFEALLLRLEEFPRSIKVWEISAQPRPVSKDLQVQISLLGYAIGGEGR